MDKVLDVADGCLYNISSSDCASDQIRGEQLCPTPGGIVNPSYCSAVVGEIRGNRIETLCDMRRDSLITAVYLVP